MPYRAATLFRTAAMAVAMLSLGACQKGGKDSDLASLDNQILGNDADPALTSALEDQILVDPALTQQSNKNAVRPPKTPIQAQYPAPVPGAASSSAARTAQSSSRPATVQRAGGAQPVAAGAAPTASASHSGGIGCGGQFDHNLQWAHRLPPAFAVFPGGRLTDAAGSDVGNCQSRVVTFTSNAPPQRVLEWYRGRAARAGYSAEHQMRQGDHVLAGLSARDGGAFYLIVTPLQGGGSDVALIANKGA
jgi:hypothetical protein